MVKNEPEPDISNCVNPIQFTCLVHIFCLLTYVTINICFTFTFVIKPLDLQFHTACLLVFQVDTQSIFLISIPTRCSTRSAQCSYTMWTGARPRKGAGRSPAAGLIAPRWGPGARLPRLGLLRCRRTDESSACRMMLHPRRPVRGSRVCRARPYRRLRPGEEATRSSAAALPARR